MTIAYEFHKKDKQPIFYNDKKEPIGWYELTLGTHKEKALCQYGSYEGLEARLDKIKKDTDKHIAAWIEAINLLDSVNNCCYLLFDFFRPIYIMDKMHIS